VLSHNMVKMAMKFTPFERLLVSVDVAQDIFKHNVYKCAQIPLIAEADNSKSFLNIEDKLLSNRKEYLSDCIK